VRSACQGDEDLRAYFGINHPDVKRFRPRFKNPYGFTVSLETSVDHYWNKGILWIAGPGEVDAVRGVPAWNLPNQVPGAPTYAALRFEVRHNIGHLFGNGHIDNTIMTSLSGRYLRDWTDPTSHVWSPGANYLNIDQFLDLVANVNLAESFALAAKFGFTVLPQGGESFPDPRALEKSFEKIFGHPPVGEVTASATRLENPKRKLHARPDEAPQGTGPVEVTFQDDQGRHSAQILTTAKATERDEGTPLFDGQHGNHFRTFGVSFVGTLLSETGITFPVLVNYNMQQRFQVVTFDGMGEKYPLLVSE
jgi:hypothetical protein